MPYFSGYIEKTCYRRSLLYSTLLSMFQQDNKVEYSLMIKFINNE